jgi:uncharacterized membrane protein
MKAAVFIALVVLLAPAAYRDPYVTIPEEVEVIAGETAHIEVLLQHVQTTMWNLRVYVDTDQIEARFLERMEIVQDNENPLIFDEEIPHGTEISAVIDIQVAANSPSGQVSIPIIAAGSKGPCMKGCEPFLVQKSTTLVIKRQDLKLALMLPEARFEAYPGENIKIDVQLKNYSTATAYIDRLEAVPEGELTVLNQTIPGQVAAGSTESVTFTVVTGGASPGSYLIHVRVIYKDQIQNKYTDSKTVYVTILEKAESPPPSTQPPQTVNPGPEPAEPESPGDKYLYFLAGMITGGSTFTVAVMVGIFLKKRRPAK